MLKRITAFTLTLLILTVFFSACSKKDGKGANLVFPISAEPRSLDPQLSEAAAENIVANCFEGLVVSYREGEFLPGVAESWEISADGLTYTFNLFKDAKWHKLASFEKSFGKETADAIPDYVTAHDFVFAFRRALDPETKSPYAAKLYSLRNANKVHKGELPLTDLAVEALGDHRLRISLFHKQDDFLKTLTDPICMPCNREFFEATQGRYGLNDDYLMCNGPFYLSAWKKGNSLFLRRNGDYRLIDKVYPLSVSFKVNPESKLYAQSLIQGSYSAALLNANDLNDEEISKLNFLELKNEVRVLALNSADPALKNINLRLALLKALDENTLANLRAGGRPRSNLIPECCLSGNFESFSDSEGLEVFSFDSQEAELLFKRALKELGLSSVSLEFLCPEELENSVRSLLQVWQKTFGVALSVHVSPLPQSTLDEKVYKGDFQICIARVRAQKSSLGDYLRTFAGSSTTNFVSFNDELFDKTLESARLAKDDLSLKEQYAQAHNLLLHSGCLLPLSSHSNYLVFAKGVEGLNHSLAGDRIYFISALKKEK